ncbi:MAG: hypothetical protein ACPGSM_13275 [Thiolinea sp.]
MSEYQYYDFRAIDRSLTPAQKDELVRLSSRAQITNRRAEFIYNHGDFRGNPEQLIQEMFDMMLYVTNWDTRRLLFRLPASLFDVSQCQDFFISEEVDHYRSGTQIILDLHFSKEEGDGESIEGGEWMDGLLPLRDELLRGDFRVLYLAWFKAAEKALCNDEIDEDSPEPTIPAGLAELSPAQQRFAELLEIDLIDIQALAVNSPPLSQQTAFKPEEWLPMLSEQEKADYLLRLSRGEDKLELHLNRRLKMLWRQASENNENHEQEAVADTNQTERRGIQALLDACQSYRYTVEKEAANKAEIAAEKKRQIAAKKRRAYLEKLSDQKTTLWQEVEKLVAQGQAKNYEQAANHLFDLYELAAQEGEPDQFATKFQGIMEQYQRRRTFVERLREKGLITE